MQISEENIVWAVEKLELFSDLPGFPKNNAMLRLQAECFLEVVHNDKIWDILKRKMEVHRQDYPDAEDLKRGQTQGFDRDTNDVDWLIKQLVKESDGRFPMPRLIRLTYQQILRPADGKEITETLD